MRSTVAWCLVPVAVCVATTPAAAKVTISNAATTNMTCAGGMCTPTAADAVLNVQDLESMLAAGNATVTTTASGVQATDIHVNARLAWSAATSLRLDAYRSIGVNRKVSVSGSGGVSLTTNDGGSGGEFVCDNSGAVSFANASGALTINGAAYTLVNSVAALAGAIAANPSGAFALAGNYDAKKDGIYATSPITTVFSGSFNGLGNTISNLSINDPTENAYVGLFAETARGSTISNIHLVNENVQGGAGNSGNPDEIVGGLVASAGGAITHSSNTGTVAGGDYSAVGGLLGIAGAAVTGSGSAASVSSGVYGPAGGLIGIADTGEITDSHATGNVSSTGMFVGGLVGFNSHPDIERSWASGRVSGTSNSTSAGGLVGANQYGVIERSYAAGAVSCQQICGGLLGWAGTGGSGTPKVSQSYATGSVTASTTGNTLAGGLVGYNELGEVSNSYATGAVSADGAGGLVGQNENYPGTTHSIRDSYSTGAVSGGTYSGGLIAYDDVQFGSTVKRAYWDMTTSGITDPSQGAGNVANDPGIKGLRDTALKSGLPKGFNPKIWNEDLNINGGLPYLINNPPKN